MLKSDAPEGSDVTEASDATEARRLTAAELFAKYDADKSNSIDSDELDLMLKECGHEPDEDTAKELMAEFVGMDDEMNFDQFAGMLRVLDTRMLFKQYDADDSGLVDVAELTEMLVACGHNSDEGMASALVIEFGGEGAEGLNQEQFGNLLASIDRKSSPDGLSHERGVVVAVEVKGAGAGTAEETSTASSASAGARRSGSTAEGSETCFARSSSVLAWASPTTPRHATYLRHPESQAAT